MSFVFCTRVVSFIHAFRVEVQAQNQSHFKTLFQSFVVSLKCLFDGHKEKKCYLLGFWHFEIKHWIKTCKMELNAIHIPCMAYLNDDDDSWINEQTKSNNRKPICSTCVVHFQVFTKIIKWEGTYTNRYLKCPPKKFSFFMRTCIL